jgi:hypothetical protein
LVAVRRDVGYDQGVLTRLRFRRRLQDENETGAFGGEVKPKIIMGFYQVDGTADMSDSPVSFLGILATLYVIHKAFTAHILLYRVVGKIEQQVVFAFLYDGFNQIAILGVVLGEAFFGISAVSLGPETGCWSRADDDVATSALLHR